LKIRYIDGNRFRTAIVAGAKRVFERQDYLNKINVFPVPDADTGTNMAATLHSVVDTVSGLELIPIYDSSRRVAESALMGARGNSGVILAQYLYGLSEELGEEIQISTKQFGEVVKRAVRYAYEALSQPREGTILTVIKDWAESVDAYAQIKDDFVELLHHALEVANRSLQATMQKLEVLRRSAVVDAGAQGFVDFLTGITQFIAGGKLREIFQYHVPEISGVAHTEVALEDIQFRYCTECMIEGKKIDLKTIRTQIENLGDSIVLAGSRHKARLHIHTNEPAKVFAQVRAYGDILQQKADDMHKQFRITHSPHPPIALVTDSACDLPTDFIEEHGIHIIPVKVSFGLSTYIDKITITPESFYEMLDTEADHPKTSQPSPADFKNLYSFLLSHYESVISIHIPEILSGTYQNALNTAREIDPERIAVIDGKSLSIGLGALVEKAAKMIAGGQKQADIVENLKTATGDSQLFVAIPNLKYLMRSGRVSKAKGFLAKVLQIKPILRLDENGAIQHFSKAISWRKAADKLLTISCDFARGKQNPQFKIAHANDRQLADRYAKALKAEFGVDEIQILPVSPVLGAHAGNGAIAIGISWSEA